MDELEYDESLEQVFIQQLSERSQKVESLLRAGQPSQALSVAIENPPFISKNDDLKNRNFAVVNKAMVAVANKDDILGPFLASLNPDQSDVLLKYVYRGLKTPENSGAMLKLHNLIVASAGLGSVVRAIVDKKGP